MLSSNSLSAAGISNGVCGKKRMLPVSSARARSTASAARSCKLINCMLHRNDNVACVYRYFFFFAAERACFERARCDAAEWPSFFSAFEVARDRLAEGFDFDALRPLRLSCAAFFFVAADAFFPAPTFTPARRAFDRPIAIA